MKSFRRFFIITLVVTLSMFAFSLTAFADFSSSSGPASKAGEPPYGITAQENASGAKLNGILQMSFTNMSCNAAWEAESGLCSSFGPNAADSRVTMRLITTSSGKSNVIKTFYVDLDQVPIYSIGALQDLVISELRPMILNAFFEADCDAAVPVNCSQEIYIKTFTNYSEANISTAPPGDMYSEFSFIADITLAVD